MLLPLFPSKPVTLYDRSINSADTHILQHIYYVEGSSLEHEELLCQRLFQRFAFCYGQSIWHPTLRHVVILHCRSVLFPTLRFNDEDADRRQLARHALRIRLNTPEMLDEGDLFAAFFLCCHFCRRRCFDEAVNHLLGFFALEQHLSSQPHRSFPLVVFLPLAKRYAVWLADTLSHLIPSLDAVFLRKIGYTDLQNFELQQAYEALGLPSRNSEASLWPSNFYEEPFRELKMLYFSLLESRSATAYSNGGQLQRLLEIQKALNAVDVESLYLFIERQIVITVNQNCRSFRLAGFTVLELFRHWLCQLILTSLLPYPATLALGSSLPKIIPANGLFASFRRIEALTALEFPIGIIADAYGSGKGDMTTTSDWLMKFCRSQLAPNVYFFHEGRHQEVYSKTLSK